MAREERAVRHGLGSFVASLLYSQQPLHCLHRLDFPASPRRWSDETSCAWASVGCPLPFLAPPLQPQDLAQTLLHELQLAHEPRPLPLEPLDDARISFRSLTLISPPTLPRSSSNGAAMKYILVSGGVISGIGKGVIGSSQLASIASPDASR